MDARPSSLLWDTIYLGGGTPSLLTPFQVGKILEAVHSRFHLDSDPEITMEVNPGTITLDDLSGFKTAGVNRISIGVQSFIDENLKFLGRIHGSGESRSALINAQKAGFGNICMDLIYGIPGQSLASWEEDLLTASSFEVEHISSYMLSFESGTEMDWRLLRGEIKKCDEDEVCRMYEAAISLLGDAGYEQYEVSNFRRGPFNGSRHNVKYWNFSPYMGFGPSAHSFEDGGRFWNHESITKYVEELECGRSAVAGSEILSRGQKMIEAIYLSLRTTRGIDPDSFYLAFGKRLDTMFGSLITKLAGEGFLIAKPHRVALTTKGMLVLDAIALEFASMISL